MQLIFNIPKPVGTFSVTQNTTQNYNNTFTNYGLGKVYSSGKNVILDTANGGIMKYLHISDSDVPITKESTGLVSPKASAVRQSSTIVFKTDPLTNIRYCEFSTLWTIPAGISSFQQIGMSDNANGTTGLICGRTLNGLLTLDPSLPTNVTYLVQIPILSQIGVLDSGDIIISGETYNYSLEATFHIESATQLSSILPYQSPEVISGNLSRMYVNNTILASGNSAYSCSIDMTDDSLNYNIISKIVNYNDSLSIINVNIGNSDQNSTAQANFPIRIVFTPNPTKPVGLDMRFDFSILINFIE